MLKVLRVPRPCRSFFKPVETFFSSRQWPYFQELVLAMAIAFGRRNIRNLKRHLPAAPHRINYNRFFIGWNWDPRGVLQKLALCKLRKMRLRKGERIYVIVDDTKRRKRGKRMAAVGKLKVVAIIASRVDWTPKRILQAHRMRWSIELFFKETKQLLGLGDYQNLSVQSAVRHLHLMCIAYLLLTHTGLPVRCTQTGHATCAQGKAQEKRLCVSPRINELQTHLRTVVLKDMMKIVERKARKPKAFNRLLQLLSMKEAA